MRSLGETSLAPASRTVCFSAKDVELKALELSALQYHYEEGRKQVIVKARATIMIDLGSVRFPFEAPLIKIEVYQASKLVCQYDIAFATFEDIMKEHWHPSIKLVDIVERTIKFLEKNLMPAEEILNTLG